MIEEILDTPDETPATPKKDVVYVLSSGEVEAMTKLLRENLECMRKILKSLERK